ncbi:hypothetical protein AAEP93_000329 [Penicillium crustosum]
MDGKNRKNGQPDCQPLQEIRIPCPVCKCRNFRSEQAFGHHMQDEHNIFPCHKCDALFACRDDLATHKSERHGKIYDKLKHKKKRKQKQKGKFRPLIQSASMPASENTPSTQLPTMQLRPQPARTRPSTSHARQPSTETPKPPAQVRQSIMQPGQSSAWIHQGHKQSAPARAEVFRSPQHQFRQMRHPLPPRPANVPQVPLGVYRVPSHSFQMLSPGFQPPPQAFQPTGQVTQVPMRFYQTYKQVPQPVGVPESPAGVYQPPVEPYLTPSPVYQTSTPIYQTHPRRMKNKVQVYWLPLQVSQFLENKHRSPQAFWNSEFFNKEPQHQQSQYQEPRQAEQVLRAPRRATNSSALDLHFPGQYSQYPIRDHQQAKEVSHFPQQDSQSLRNSQSLVQHSQDVEIPESVDDSKSPDQGTQQEEQASQSLGLDPPLELPQFPVQVLQDAEDVTQSPKRHSQSLGNPEFLVCHQEQAKAIPHSEKPSQSAVQIPDQTEQVSHSSLHLSAHDPIAAEANETETPTTSIPATNITTPDLFIPPPPTDPTFSLVYGTMPHRWTDLEPLEQTLIIRYLLATCHSPKRLHSQGYNTPKTINTKACVHQNKPHQHHIDPRPANPNSRHRKAIVLDCEMIETTVCTSELAFITAIDFLTGEVLINSYVTPTAPVTNWLTPVSGITQEKMDTAIAEGNVFVSNADARGALRKFLNRDTVLIGHALQHDLRTLSLIHGRIVDTSVITSEAVFSDVSSKTALPRIWGLDTLAEELIGIKTRRGEGHNSLEDALATREILIWCLRGPQCLKHWAKKTRGSLAHMRNRRWARRNRGNGGGGANANNG